MQAVAEVAAVRTGPTRHPERFRVPGQLTMQQPRDVAVRARVGEGVTLEERRRVPVTAQAAPLKLGRIEVRKPPVRMHPTVAAARRLTGPVDGGLDLGRRPEGAPAPP